MGAVLTGNGCGGVAWFTEISGGSQIVKDSRVATNDEAEADQVASFFSLYPRYDILNTPRAHVRLAPEHWYEDASEDMWTGHLGLWTRHFQMLR